MKSCIVLCCLNFLLIEYSFGLLCYNGTFNNTIYGDDPLDRTLFNTDIKRISRLRCFSTIMCRENSMCFVRSWAARAKHYWIVQRGCYQIGPDDPFPRAMTTPTRAMTCRYERLPEAEYKVCFCNANWCNSASLHKNSYKYNNIFSLLSFLYVLSLVL